VKRIVLVRHATAADTGPRGSDFHRRLKKRGRREAAIMADRVAGTAGRPDLALSSPADRAMETARIFAARLGYPEKRIVATEALYGGLLPEDFLAIVHRLPESARMVMLFGHDPSFTEFAGALAPEFEGVLPKAGVVVIDVASGSWSRIALGQGKLVLSDQPPEPKVQKRMEEDVLVRLADAVRAGILEALVNAGVSESPAVSRTVAGTSERLAKALRPYAGLPRPKGRGRLAARARDKAKPARSAKKTSTSRARTRRRKRP
jgi:phosphohistidine phosphatase